ncbi:tetratricopeptide repeat protein [Seongchinamella unica]|uniref:tetratricopeptide repeat protein n=1 Tax=Seongchinamella unica TaxID=2547392 RepID=UPI0014054B2E|nr:tetratricopeptide repeat protein [Seongchinamella unica]
MLLTQARMPLLAIALLLLPACGTNPYSLPRIETGEPEVTEPVPEAPAPSAPVDPPVNSAAGAHSGLLAKAESAMARGDYEESLAYLQRAQRIDPDNAEVYLAMAQTHSAAGNSAQARATAERGLLYCSGVSQCNALRAYLP